MASEPKYKNWGECIFWVYSNLNMYNAAKNKEAKRFDKYYYIIRSKAFKSYRDGSWSIHSLYEDNNDKEDFGKSCCWYCGHSAQGATKLTVEHIFPKVKGGDDSFDNLVYSCKSCNSSKNDKDLIQWLTEEKHTIPSFALARIYMKLVYKYSVENSLMEKSIEDIQQMNLPFNPSSLKTILEIFSDAKYL